MGLILLGTGGSAAAAADPGVDPSTWTNKTLLLDWDSASVLTDVDGVYRWDDDSGANYDFTQATGSKKPDLVVDGIQFDGIDDELDNATGMASLFTAAYTTVWAVEYLSIANDAALPYQNDGVIYNSSAYMGIYARSSNKVGVSHYTGTYDKLEIAVPDATAKLIIGVRWNGTTIYLRVNGGSWNSQSLGLSSTAGLMYMGVNWNRTAPMDGKIFHAVWTSDAKSESDVDDVMTFYNNKIGAY